MNAVTVQPSLLVLGVLSLLAGGAFWAARASGRLRGWEIFLVLSVAFLVLSWLPASWAVHVVTVLNPWGGTP